MLLLIDKSLFNNSVKLFDITLHLIFNKYYHFIYKENKK